MDLSKFDIEELESLYHEVYVELMSRDLARLETEHAKAPAHDLFEDKPGRTGRGTDSTIGVVESPCWETCGPYCVHKQRRDTI